MEPENNDKQPVVAAQILLTLYEGPEGIASVSYVGDVAAHYEALIKGLGYTLQNITDTKRVAAQQERRIVVANGPLRGMH